jgi:hypothetical protein
MRTTAKLAASALMVVASVLAVGCAGDQDARRVNEPSSAPATETTHYGTESYASPSSPSDNKGLSGQGARGGDSYGSERGAKNPGGDISPHGAKAPGPDNIGQQRPESNPATPDVSPGSLTCPSVPPGAGHGSSGIKPGPMSGGDARTTDCPDWQESEQAIPGGRGTIQ